MTDQNPLSQRRFGRSEHFSSLAIFGAVALMEATPAQTETALQAVIDAGVNHIDVAPSYGLAEERLGPWMPQIRERFFLGCKTMERTRNGALEEMQRSLERLQTDSFDLYQLHDVSSFEELDNVTAPGGALEALVEARHQGAARFLGITGHGVDAPAIFTEALNRFDFDSVLFPLNFIQYANPQYRRDAEELLRVCQKNDVGVMAIKTVTRAPWGGRPKTHQPWYEPFSDLEHIQPAVNFALSQPITGLCTVGDLSVLPLVLQACQNFTLLDAAEQEALIATAGEYTPLFT